MSYSTFQIKGTSVIFNHSPMRSQKLDTTRDKILEECNDAILEKSGDDYGWGGEPHYGSDLIDIGMDD